MIRMCDDSSVLIVFSFVFFRDIIYEIMVIKEQERNLTIFLPSYDQRTRSYQE